MKIVLLGYMASGKTLVAKILAEKLQMQQVDLDAFIEEKEQVSIAKIFKKHGEIYFRKKETLYLKELLLSNTPLVISLGGGTPCYGNNMELILKNTMSIYLKASVFTLFKRLKKEAAKRPLITAIGVDKLQEFIAKHLFERAPVYEKASHTVLVNNKSVLEIVTEIKTLL